MRVSKNILLEGSFLQFIKKSKLGYQNYNFKVFTIVNKE